MIMDRLKSPFLILLIISLVYIGILGVTTHSSMVVLGLCALNALEIGIRALKLYLDSKVVEPKEETELDEIQNKIKLEEAKIKLLKLEKRETNPLSSGNNALKRYEF